nr:MAG TPA: Putative ATPase subunit of terminase (gpP-like) [Caudoviricetes sp.]
MVLDKKTNKEIAETTGLKYWEVRDYIQYIGLAGIREEMLGRKPGRRKKDGYNKGKAGPNVYIVEDMIRSETVAILK